MNKTAMYRTELSRLANWDTYLLEHSGLPGPRANLELAQAAADVGDETRFRRWINNFDEPVAPAHAPQVFLPVCGTIGLGKMLANGNQEVLRDLRQLAADPRWRVREAVAMALQRWGDVDMPALLEAMAEWSRGAFLEQRAVVAGLCEPRLLVMPGHARRVLALLDAITSYVSEAAERNQDNFRVLRQALGNGWSVAVVALPAGGKALMEQWFDSGDRDVRWIMRENLKKDRLRRMDAGWVAQWQRQIAQESAPGTSDGAML